MTLVPSSWSLRRTLLAMLLPAVLALGSVELWFTYRTTLDAANAAYDRSLLGAIKAMDANISTESGGVAVELPYRMLEFFELTASGDVYFRVATEDGLAEVGNANLPRPAVALNSRVPHFYDAVYFGEKLRIGAYMRELERPLAPSSDPRQRIIIQVAESLTSRNAFTHKLLLQAIARDVLLLLVAVTVLLAALNMALRPLKRLRDEVGSRSPLDLTPVDGTSVPSDVRPLVEGINQHMLRNRQITEARRRFIDDASHQLRTPLSTLRTQLDYARREPDFANVQSALDALSLQLDDAIRATNQMLALARADAAELRMQPVDLQLLADQVARELVLPAREKQIDFGVEIANSTTEGDIVSGAPLVVMGRAELLREALSNLVHNAIRFAPECGRITLFLRRGANEAVLSVVDNGPGVPPDQLSRLGERFFRASNAATGGSGLGLAIASSVAERHGGYLSVRNADQDGCVADLHLPLAVDPVLPRPFAHE
jgi:two-component system sensor histidine kinase TctE